MRITGARRVVEALTDAGADLVFGIPGTHNIELVVELERSPLRPVSVRMPEARTTIGTQSIHASAIPDRALVTPAPGTRLRTPIRSELRPTPSAMNEAACSSVTSTGRSGDRSSSS